MVMNFLGIQDVCTDNTHEIGLHGDTTEMEISPHGCEEGGTIKSVPEMAEHIIEGCKDLIVGNEEVRVESAVHEEGSCSSESQIQEGTDSVTPTSTYNILMKEVSCNHVEYRNSLRYENVCQQAAKLRHEYSKREDEDVRSAIMAMEVNQDAVHLAKMEVNSNFFFLSNLIPLL